VWACLGAMVGTETLLVSRQGSRTEVGIFHFSFTEKGISTRQWAQPDKIPRQTPGGSSQYPTFYAVLSQTSYLQLGPSVDLSDISKVLEVDDISTLPVHT
jgi:hypothetical protein